jgi:biphenyl 2,3-dioxygenase beta subunit/benzene/toluene dioxygenase beta subunit
MSAAAFRAASDSAACAPGTPLYGEILAFLYYEAELLDSYRFDEWVELFAEDVHYAMPVRTNQVRSSGSGFQDMTFFDDNIVSLRTRVKRLATDSAWAETPPSRTRHFVSNVLVAPGAKPDEYAIGLNFMVTRTRSDHGYQMFTGRREDVLRRIVGGQFKIAKRRILGDQTVLTATNLSVMF